MATFGGPTVPITIQMPASQLPQTVTPPAPQQQQQPPPVEKPPQPKADKLPHARYYVFPWKA